jgi:hypothetical protein
MFTRVDFDHFVDFVKGEAVRILTDFTNCRPVAWLWLTADPEGRRCKPLIAQVPLTDKVNDTKAAFVRVLKTAAKTGRAEAVAVAMEIWTAPALPNRTNRASRRKDKTECLLLLIESRRYGDHQFAANILRGDGKPRATAFIPWEHVRGGLFSDFVKPINGRKVFRLRGGRAVAVRVRTRSRERSAVS